MRTALLRGLPAALLTVLSLTTAPAAHAAETVPLTEAVAMLPLATESRDGYTREAFKHWKSEYPMASTWQGAEHGGGDYSRRMINGWQNEEGGKALGRFYLYNRIIEKDKFLVWIK
ncbi:hypothetical protein ACFZAD_30880 [Streptomyces iakyrus]|uniref:NucA/NucB deoxyribonuclease domain-containing protein n=1 Tax=Streptomyces iakyrus TaxID=68219 RepID=UPI0036E24227